MSEPLPTIDFITFVLSFVEAAHQHLGEAPGLDGRVEIDLELARQNIELLGLLEEKTKGNLSGEEDRLIHHALLDLRQKLEAAQAAQ